MMKISMRNVKIDVFTTGKGNTERIYGWHPLMTKMIGRKCTIKTVVLYPDHHSNTKYYVEIPFDIIKKNPNIRLGKTYGDTFIFDASSLRFLDSFKRRDKVLVSNDLSGPWKLGSFGSSVIRKNEQVFKIFIENKVNYFKYCVKYEKNEHLLSTQK